MKTCGKTKQNETEVRRRPRKRTTSVSKTEKVVIETISESASSSNDDKNK